MDFKKFIHIYILKKLFLLIVFSLVSVITSNFAVADTGNTSNSFSQAVSEPALLTPDQAFNYQLKTLDAKTLVVNFKVAPGYYLYRDRIVFKLQQQPLANVEFLYMVCHHYNQYLELVVM